MDSDRFAARLAAAKRQFAFQHNHSSQLDRLCIDDFEAEDDSRSDFPCPYCYEHHDFASLCSHLEEEHSFESRAAVCPICSVKVSRDMLSHITVQHAHLFKLQRRRRLRRVAIPNSQTLSLLGRDLREAHLQVLLGGSSYRSSNNASNNAPTDPFLSSLILNFPSSEAEEISKSIASNSEDTSAKNTTSTKTWKQSFDPSLSLEEREKKIKEATMRAGFVQGVLLSTMFIDQ